MIVVVGKILASSSWGIAIEVEGGVSGYCAISGEMSRGLELCLQYLSARNSCMLQADQRHAPVAIGTYSLVAPSTLTRSHSRRAWVGTCPVTRRCLILVQDHVRRIRRDLRV
jgi:hypothetical protein